MATDEGSIRAQQDPDPTAQIPIHILAHVLSLLPLRTVLFCGYGTLSKPWLAACRDVLADAPELDFGLDFSKGLLPERYSCAVDAALALHEAETLRALKIAFHPGSSYEQQFCVHSWLELAAAKSVSVLELDLLVAEPATKIFGRWLQWKDLANLSLRRCCLVSPFESKSLKMLSLWELDIKNDALHDLLDGCPQLSKLQLTKCNRITAISIFSTQILSCLAIIDCQNLSSIEIQNALRSFHFCGKFCYFDVSEAGGIMDAYISFMEERPLRFIRTYWFPLSDMSHITALTLCGASLENLSKIEDSWDLDLPLTFVDLKDLQFITEKECHFVYLFDFLGNCNFPALINLIFEFPTVDSDSRSWKHSLSTEAILSLTESILPFTKLRFMSIRGFNGHKSQLEIVEFFLEYAVGLKTIVLVMTDLGAIRYTEDEIAALSKSLDGMQNPNSCAQILLCEPGRDLVGYPPPPHVQFRAQVLGYLTEEMEL